MIYEILVNAAAEWLYLRDRRIFNAKWANVEYSDLSEEVKLAYVIDAKSFLASIGIIENAEVAQQ